ncbi:MAG: hypothetical protein ACRD2N_10795 [Vicinamibacterales bacterium]
MTGLLVSREQRIHFLANLGPRPALLRDEGSALGLGLPESLCDDRFGFTPE